MVERYDISKHLKRCSLALACAGIAALGFAADVKAQTRMLKSGTTMNDVLSKRVVGESYFDRKKTVEVILIGDRIVFEYQDGRTMDVAYFSAANPNPHVYGFGTCVWILTDFFQDFKKQKEIVGQANLSLRVNANNTCEILTKTIYVPGCTPYTGGAPIDPRVQEFWSQIRAGVAAVNPVHLRLPGPEQKSMTLELVVGRDPSMFPRYATPFNGMIVRDSSGKFAHTKAFVSDAPEK